MRTVTKTMYNRLEAQADEAETLGLKKVSSHLQNQISKLSTRDTTDFYKYSSDEMQNDVESLLWDAVMRISDFYGTNVDAMSAHAAVESIANDLIEEIRITSNIKHGVGAYEPNVPGEMREHVEIELEDKDD